MPTFIRPTVLRLSIVQQRCFPIFSASRNPGSQNLPSGRTTVFRLGIGTFHLNPASITLLRATTGTLLVIELPYCRIQCKKTESDCTSCSTCMILYRKSSSGIRGPSMVWAPMQTFHRARHSRPFGLFPCAYPKRKKGLLKIDADFVGQRRGVVHFFVFWVPANWTHWKRIGKKLITKADSAKLSTKWEKN